ncbi:MAG TPA: roadblock/LC7 domain-containing protein [Candidatus Sulfotelmatobacter sp.]|nr:roadblock/LC7 domain-containing protein [Candidatus Sulfotelmatobacter sp.]
MSALANNFKKNFAGLLRGLLRKVDNSDSTDPQPMPRNLLRQPAPGPVPVPQYPGSMNQESMASAMHAASYSTPSAPMASRAPTISELEMPLLPILEKLPADLQAKSMLGGVNLQEATISVPVKKVLPQLALGAVKITFGELRNAAPSLFRMGEEYDSLPITLPLNEVLSRLNPALITRNPGQRSVPLPSDIAEPFGPGGMGATFTAAPTATQNPTQAAPVAPGVKPAPPTTHFYKKAVPSEPIKMPTPPAVAAQPLPFVPRATTPAAPPPPAQMPRATTPIPMPRATTPTPPPTAPVPPPAAPQPLSFTPRATTPAAPPTPRVNFHPGNGNGGNGGGLHQSPPPMRSMPNNGIPNIPMQRPAAPTPPPASRPAPAPAPRPAPAPVPEAPSILAPLAALSEDWPESLRVEIAQLNLTNAGVALPIHLVEAALKRGRVIFSWHHVRSWIKPTPPGASAHDPMELELPLKVIAPLFLPGQKQEPRPQAKADLPPSSIPNLFFGFPQPQPEELAAPVNMPEAVPLVKPLDAKLNDSNFYVWGEGEESPRLETEYKRAQAPATDFTSRRAQPKEIIDRAMKLPGVTGAIIALPDGLKVAYQLPQELNADTVAAFLPQLFSRVGQCAKELRMGELNNLNFTLGNIPWKIFRVNAVYFAAFGVAGVSLPTAQLAMLAGELDRKK